MARKYLLSLAGGGCKGLIEAILLDEIYKRTNKHPKDLFDFFIGTSTGGIISLLLNTPTEYSTKEIIDFYLKEDLKKIFKSKIFKFPWDIVKYPSENIENVLKSRFGPYQLKDCKKPVVITTYDTVSRDSKFINSLEHKFKEYKLWECARATSAAPTYFKPFKLENMSAIDGGFFANTPALFGYVEAKKFFPDDEWVVIHIGTGSSITSIPYKKLVKWNIIDWASNIFSICNDGEADTSIYALKVLLNKNNYYFFDLKLSENMDDMDNAEETNLNKLKEITEKEIKTNWKKDLGRLIEDLIKKGDN